MVSEEGKRIFTSAAGAISTAILASLYQAGFLGRNLFAIQVLCTLIGLSWVPFLFTINAIDKVPMLIATPLFLIWTITCFLPAFAALLINLFTGHRHPNAHWFEGVWRIYAIMALWMLIAVLIEKVLKPYWKENSHKWSFGRAPTSVAAQGRQIALDKRAAAFEAIKQRVAMVKKKKKVAQKGIEEKKEQISKSDESIAKIGSLLEKARERAALDEGDKDAAKEVDDLVLMADNVRLQAGSLHTDIERFEIDVDDATSQLVQLQSEWKAALPIENYTSFYR